jgi:hypothetical protein
MKSREHYLGHNPGKVPREHYSGVYSSELGFSPSTMTKIYHIGRELEDNFPRLVILLF